MKLSETTVDHAGSFRCCFSAFDVIADDDDVSEGGVVDCKYCKSGSHTKKDVPGGFVLRGSVWIPKWRDEENQAKAGGAP